MKTPDQMNTGVPKTPEDKKSMSRRKFLKEAALLAGGSLIVGTTGYKIAKKLVEEEKKEIIGKGVVLLKFQDPDTSSFSFIDDDTAITTRIPGVYKLKVKIGSELFDITVSKKQFDQYNLQDEIPVKYGFDSDGKIKSPKLLNTNEE